LESDLQQALHILHAILKKEEEEEEKQLKNIY